MGEAGMVRVSEAQVRLPDVSFVAWNHFPNRKLPAGSILDVVPDFAVEILSPTNTEKEMKRKRQEYFDGGSKLVWIVDPNTRTVQVFTSRTAASSGSSVGVSPRALRWRPISSESATFIWHP